MKLPLTGCLIAVGLIAACGPSEKQKKQFAEEKRIACLNKFCEGDTVPEHDTSKEVAVKLNGQWFIGPRKYFSTGMNGAAFYWSSKTPARPDVPNFPENVIANSGNADEVTIEIFLRSHDGVRPRSSWYQDLQAADAQGRVISKTELRPGLEAWRVKDDVEIVPPTWYIATRLKDANGEPPILFCRNTNPEFNRCTGGFMWRPKISADFRFSTKYGADWPEIYQEIIRVTNLLKKA